MRLGIMQPYLFPYIGYYQLIKAVDKFVIYDDVSFINKGWINRNNILVNNEAYSFTTPLKEASQNRRINEIALDQNETWKIKFLKTLEHSYRKAPYFSQVALLIQDVFNPGFTHIHQLARESVILIARYLGMQTGFVESSSKYNNVHLKGQNRILDICVQEGADHYINPVGGIEIYSRPNFENIGIKINFIKTKFITYPQFSNEFISNLSIIDVLMFNTKEEIQGMLNSYELI